MNTNVKVIGLTRLGIKPESTAPEADALTTRPSELFHAYLSQLFCLRDKHPLSGPVRSPSPQLVSGPRSSEETFQTYRALGRLRCL